MRGWSVLGSVLLMGSGALVWSLLIMARWIGSKLLCIISLHRILKDRHMTGLSRVGHDGSAG